MGRLREVEARQPRGAPPGAVRRADRFARDAAAETAQVRDLAHRLGDPLKPGRQEHPRAYLREPRIVLARGDAGIPRPHPRAGGVEEAGAGARDRIGGNRYPAVPRSLRPQFGAARPGPGGGIEIKFHHRDGETSEKKKLFNAEDAEDTQRTRRRCTDPKRRESLQGSRKFLVASRPKFLLCDLRVPFATFALKLFFLSRCLIVSLVKFTSRSCR